MLLIHAKYHSPDYVTMVFWPFALKEAAYQLNWLSLWSEGHSCEATYFDVDKYFINPSIFHTFGSPCFVLNFCLQSGVEGTPKWEPQSCLGIYVGHSPSHAELAALVLNPWTGRVSPQFHVVFNDHFTTVHSWRKMRFHLIGLTWLRNHVRKLLRSIMSLTRLGSFLIPTPETFLSLNGIRMSPTTLMGLSLTKKRLVTMSHKICSLLECSLLFMLAFPVIWTCLEYLRLKIISNAHYCFLSHHIGM